MWNFHVDILQDNHGFDMILGYDILSKIKIDLYWSKNTIGANVDMCEGCMAPMKDIWE